MTNTQENNTGIQKVFEIKLYRLRKKWKIFVVFTHILLFSKHLAYEESF